MIERIVLVRLKEGFADAEERAEIASYSREALIRIPGVTGINVGVAADDTSPTGWDLCIRVHFDSLGDVAPYAAHPDHRAYVDQYLRPKLDIIKAWNFESV